MWFRLLLIGILIYVIVSAVGRFLSGGKKDGGRGGKTDIRDGSSSKGFPGDIGEYVDYEELDEEEEDDED